MPITNVNKTGDNASNRTTFRPPWVKTANENTGMAAQQPSWMKKKPSETPATTSTSSTSTTNNNTTSATTKPATNTTQSKTSSPSKTTTIQAKFTESGKKVAAAEPVPKKTNTTSTAKSNNLVDPPPKEAKLQSKEVKVPVMTDRRTSQTAPLKAVGLRKVAPEPVKKVESSSEEEDEEETDDDESYEEVTDEEGDEDQEQDDESAEMDRLLMLAQKEAAEKRQKERLKKEAEEREREKAKIMVKLKPVLKKTPTIDDMPKDKPKSFLETPKLKKVAKKTDEIIDKPSKTKIDLPTLKKVVKKDSPVVVKAEPEWKNVDAVLQSAKNIPPPPPPPMMLGPNGVPLPPPPPPPAGMTAAEKKELSDKQKQTLDRLKTRARRRPDWSEMMAEVEQGRKLRKVQCNDRSQPILTCKSMAKVDGQFIFETEKDEKASDHNQLLKQIQFGIKLKSVKTNDRSKPHLAGLRKFRKQMTIEEQIKKSESRAMMQEAPEESEEDEMDDIDKLRDDLQSSKQMLAQELRNKEAQERENKRLLAKIQNLEAELGRERSRRGSRAEREYCAPPVLNGADADETLVKALKDEADEAHKISKDLEKKYHEIAEQLDVAKNEIEEKNRRIATLEKQLSQGPGAASANRRESEAVPKDSSPEPDANVSDSESDEDEEQKEIRRKRRLGREVTLLRHKLTRFKEKEMIATQERQALKMALKNQQLIMKEEKKKFKALQKEVNKMAKMMADEEENDDDDDEKESKGADKAESEASESEESESEDSDSEEESDSEPEPEGDDDEAKKTNLEPRVKRHEGILAALRKGNYLHQANVDRIKDEINHQRELSDQLQHDLDSVLSELG